MVHTTQCKATIGDIVGRDKSTVQKHLKKWKMRGCLNATVAIANLT